MAEKTFFESVQEFRSGMEESLNYLKVYTYLLSLSDKYAHHMKDFSEATKQLAASDLTAYVEQFVKELSIEWERGQEMVFNPRFTALAKELDKSDKVRYSVVIGSLDRQKV